MKVSVYNFSTSGEQKQVTSNVLDLQSNHVNIEEYWGVYSFCVM